MARPEIQGSRWRWLLLLVLGLVLAAAWLGPWGPSSQLPERKLYQHLASPLLRLLVYLGVGLLLGQAIESLGWAARLGGWAVPVLQWGHLKAESGASFTAAFFSGIMANTMLMTFYQEGKISRREMAVTYLVNGGLACFRPLAAAGRGRRRRPPGGVGAFPPGKLIPGNLGQVQPAVHPGGV